MEEEEEEKDEEVSRTHLCLLLSLLPEDLIINNILLKLPVRSVMRLRCVCKYFWSLTTTPSFVNFHLDHAKTDQIINNHPALILISYLDEFQSRPFNYYCKPLFYSWTLKQIILINTTPTTTSCCLSSEEEEEDDNTNTVVVVEEVKIPCAHLCSSPPYTFQIWGSCNGLLCVVEAPDERHGRPRRRYDEYNGPCIWNPCTREFKKLPPPLELYVGRICSDTFMRVQHLGFGYDPTMDDYKVVVWIHWNSFREDVPSKSIINVCTLGASTNSNFPLWRCSSSYKPFGGIRQRQRTSGLYFRGALHWIIEVVDNHLMEGPFRKQIVSFDIKAEAVRELLPRPPPPHPHGVSEGDQDWVLQELRGCLCLLIYTTHEKRIIDVWMMKEDYGCCCWTNLLTIVAEPPAPPAPDRHLILFDPQTDSKPLRLCENGEILILENKKGLYMYDPNKKTTRSVIETRDLMKGINFFYMETYIESLVSLKTVFRAAL